MSAIYRKVKAVEKIFDQLSKDIEQYQQQSQLSCAAGCGRCCLKPDIEATVLEFLPFAYYMYKQGTAQTWLDKMYEQPDSALCNMLKPFMESGERGFCSEYQYRGLICRLFGFSATRNKYGMPVLATCRTIKTEQQDKYEAAQQAIAAGGYVPMSRDYYMQLSAIDFVLGNEFYPINKAISRALEIVLSYYSYRNNDPDFRKAS